MSEDDRIQVKVKMLANGQFVVTAIKDNKPIQNYNRFIAWCRLKDRVDAGDKQPGEIVAICSRGGEDLRAGGYLNTYIDDKKIVRYTKIQGGLSIELEDGNKHDIIFDTNFTSQTINHVCQGGGYHWDIIQVLDWE